MNEAPNLATTINHASSIEAVSAAARSLSGSLEAVTGSVYFSPECHANYVALGFAPSVNRAREVHLPDGPAYFTSRGSALGQVHGNLVAATFGVFNPAAVIPAVAYGWSLTDAPTIAKARADGATAQLVRLLGDTPDGLSEVTAVFRRAVEVLRPEGRALFAGLVSLPEPSHPVGAMWWLGDCLREFRGDAHTAAWISAGLDAVEIGLLTELWWGLPLHTYVRTRAWSVDDVAAAKDRLYARGLLEGEGFSDAGRVLRSEIEANTDRQMIPALRAIDNDLAATVGTLSQWSKTVRAGHGYLAAGPMDLASRT
jgi:hypothetical protein